ncbi:MAG: sigma-70 family RNA polymerase sigma factor [Longimicrobiales bacterium]|nr:sigma-70 family RNA polymerase sigma factor [Longimicrobiales bacterium]
MTEQAAEAPAGFEEEALPHLDAVYRFALRLSGAPDRAEDLVQETFLRAYRSWDQYTRGTAAKSWLFTICRNVFLRGRERRKRHDEIVEENVDRAVGSKNPVNPVWVSVIGVDPEGDFFDSIVDDKIIEAIEELPEEYRMAVILSDVEGLPYAEVAELLDVPVGTVKSRLFRGRRRLQEVLYDYAVEMGYISERKGTNGS